MQIERTWDIQRTSWHCVKCVRIRTYSGPYFPSLGLCGNIRTRITPNTDTFYAVWILSECLMYVQFASCLHKVKEAATRDAL